MKSLLMVPLLLLFLTAWIADPSPATIAAADCQDTIKAVVALTRDLELPEHLLQENPVKMGDEFDVNDYFSVLTHLTIEPGYVLDYVYYYGGIGANPVIYARPEDQPPFQTVSDYEQAVENDSSGEVSAPYLDHIVVDDTAEGYFELVVLNIMASQFYLFWHANYNDLMVICGREGLDSLLEQQTDFGQPIPDDVQKTARKLELEPTVTFLDDSVQVAVTTFTKWGGFVRTTFTISRDFPHTILEIKPGKTVPFNCGVMF